MQPRKSIEDRLSAIRANDHLRAVADFEGKLRQAREICAFAHNPIEWIPSGAFLGNILLSKLGLGPKPATTDFVYTLYLPAMEEGIAWWIAALIVATRSGHMTREEAKARLRACEQQRRLRLFRVAPELCGVPALVTNPRDSNVAVFNAYPAPERDPPVSITCADIPSTERWWVSVFVPFENGRVSREPIPCPF